MVFVHFFAWVVVVISGIYVPYQLLNSTDRAQKSACYEQATGGAHEHLPSLFAIRLLWFNAIKAWIGFAQFLYECARSCCDTHHKQTLGEWTIQDAYLRAWGLESAYVPRPKPQ
jgi:hypothetical protein